MKGLSTKHKGFLSILMYFLEKTQSLFKNILSIFDIGVLSKKRKKTMNFKIKTENCIYIRSGDKFFIAEFIPKSNLYSVAECDVSKGVSFDEFYEGAGKGLLSVKKYNNLLSFFNDIFI